MLQITDIEPGYALPLGDTRPAAYAHYVPHGNKLIRRHFRGLGETKSIAPGLLSLGASVLVVGGLLWAISKY
jgi:hypothetical protein